MKSKIGQVAFSGGEISPKLDARVDQQKYRDSLRQCLNMLPLKQGPLTRRPGTQFIAQAKYQNTPGHNYAVRTIEFVFSPSTTFELEFGHNYIRFYSNGQQVTVNSAATWVSGTSYAAGAFVEDPGAGNAIYYCTAAVSGTTQPHSDPTHWVAQVIYEVPSPYGADALTGSVWSTDVWKIEPCQINDVVYIVHPNYPPYVLTMLGNTDWTMAQAVFNVPALLDQNSTDTTLVPNAIVGQGITLTASAPAWVTGNYYNTVNSVLQGGVIYNCLVAHVSGAFATDLASGYWQVATIFQSGHVGSTWQISNLRPSAYVEYDGVAATGFAAGQSATIQCLGNWECRSYGTWSADIEIRRSLDGGQTWDTVRAVAGRSSRNFDIAGTSEQLALFQIVVGNVAVPTSPGAINPYIVFECVDAMLNGLVQITAVTDAYHATANVVTELYAASSAPAWVSGNNYYLYDQAEDPGDSNNIYLCILAINGGTTQPHSDPTHWQKTSIAPTSYWAEAAWSTYRGFPQAVCSFQQRIIYAATAYQPQTIWGTVQNDLQNFDLGDQTLATDSFTFSLNAPGRGPINWLKAQLDLFIGFSGAEWVANSGATTSGGASAGTAITPTNFNAVEHSAWGSAPFIQPLLAGNALLFCQRQANAILQTLFSVYTEKYMAQDITALADHLFPSGIVQMAYQPHWRGQSQVWAVTQQGQLCSLAYDQEQGIFAWSRHQTGFGQTDANGNPIANDNGFESVSVIPGQNGNDDEVWVVVNRLMGNNPVMTRCIERINPNNWEMEFSGAPNPPAPNFSDAFYVDCGTTVRNPGGSTITGLSYLNGRWVVGLADGMFFGPIFVSSGALTIPNSPSSGPAVVQLGLPIRYQGQPMRIDADPRLGSTQGEIKQVSDLFIRVMNSIGGSVINGVTGANAPLPVPINYPNANPFAGPNPVTSPTDIRLQPQPMPSPAYDPVVIVTGNDALPLTVLALVWKYDDTSQEG